MLRKTAIILGGHGDIGSSTCEKFAKNGYNIATTFLTTYKADLKKKITSFGVEYYEEKVDLSNFEAVQGFFSKLKQQFDSLDVLVCAQGLSTSEKLFVDVPYDEIERLVGSNFMSVIFACQCAMKIFSHQKYGNIVLVSSVYGEYGGACEAVYSACKAGLLGLGMSLASEGAGVGVRVNCVCPGCIDTKMTAEILKTQRGRLCKSIPLGRIGPAEDVANACAFLASAEADYITGAVINVSGGAREF